MLEDVVGGSRKLEGKQNVVDMLWDSRQQLEITSQKYILHRVYIKRKRMGCTEHHQEVYLQQTHTKNYTFSRPHPNKSLRTEHRTCAAGREMGVGNEDTRKLMDK